MRLRRLVIDLVVATDMRQHFSILGQWAMSGAARRAAARTPSTTRGSSDGAHAREESARLVQVTSPTELRPQRSVGGSDRPLAKTTQLSAGTAVSHPRSTLPSSGLWHEAAACMRQALWMPPCQAPQVQDCHCCCAASRGSGTSGGERAEPRTAGGPWRQAAAVAGAAWGLTTPAKGRGGRQSRHWTRLGPYPAGAAPSVRSALALCTLPGPRWH